MAVSENIEIPDERLEEVSGGGLSPKELARILKNEKRMKLAGRAARPIIKGQRPSLRQTDVGERIVPLQDVDASE